MRVGFDGMALPIIWMMYPTCNRHPNMPTAFGTPSPNLTAMNFLRPLSAAATGTALIAAIAAPAFAQTYVNDDPVAIEEFLTALYTVLEQEREGAYILATEEYSDQDNLNNAGFICEAFSYGASVDQIIQIFMEDEGIQDLTVEGQEIAGQYLGGVIFAGGFYYCPEYGQEPVLDFLEEEL
jgi:hypothetical protein